MARPLIEPYKGEASTTGGESDFSTTSTDPWSDASAPSTPAVMPSDGVVGGMCKDDLVLLLTIVNLVLVVLNIWISHNNE